MNVDEYTRWKNRLEHNSNVLGGSVVLPGTRVAVRHIAALLNRGATIAEICADYCLTAHDVEFARRYVEEQT